MSTFLDAHEVQALEATLHARVGGGPADDQLLENETSRGYLRLRRPVRLRLSGVDPAGVARVFLESLGAGSAPERVRERVRQDSELLTVGRAVTRITAAGKVQHVHVEQRSAIQRAGSAR